jgi:hypothetical protein
MRKAFEFCSLEYAKQLKELGVEQDSWFSYFETGRYGLILEESNTNFELDHYIVVQRLCSAFSIAELGELLPNRVTISEDNIPFESFTIVIKKFYTVNEDRTTTNNYILNYECDSTEIAGENAWLRRYLMSNIFDPNLANAMARMLIYLIENGLMKNDQCG